VTVVGGVGGVEGAVGRIEVNLAAEGLAEAGFEGFGGGKTAARGGVGAGEDGKGRRGHSNTLHPKGLGKTARG